MLEEIGKLIKEARNEKSLSPEDLAEKLGVNAEEITLMEAGNMDSFHEWTVSKLRALAEILDVNVSQLVGEPILKYDEWALVLSSLVQYSAHRPGLEMQEDMVALIQKVRSFIPNKQSPEDV